MVNVLHLQNVPAMQTVQMNKYVMLKVNACIAKMIQNVILDKNVFMVLVKMQDVTMIETA